MLVVVSVLGAAQVLQVVAVPEQVRQFVLQAAQVPVDVM